LALPNAFLGHPQDIYTNLKNKGGNQKKMLNVLIGTENTGWQQSGINCFRHVSLLFVPANIRYILGEHPESIKKDLYMVLSSMFPSETSNNGNCGMNKDINERFQ